MNTSPPHAWHEVVMAAKRLDWIGVTSALENAPRLRVALLPNDDYVRPAVLAVAMHGPIFATEMLRSRLIAPPGCCYSHSCGWVRQLVEGVFFAAASEHARCLARPRWPRANVTFARLVGVPRIGVVQDQVVVAVVRTLLEEAVSIEAQFPRKILARDDLALHVRTSRWRLRATPGSFRLAIIGEIFGTLCGTRGYPHLSRELLLEALQRLNWPTLRSFGWLSHTPIPGGVDARWEPFLLRRIVRAAESGPAGDEPHHFSDFET